jgi:hypothetical protein
MNHQLYWGDLHSHCSISYGHGTAQQALLRARDQLDFCSITGHAFWPDMPTDRSVYAEIIDYHHEGFARLARNWPELLALQDEVSDSKFVALPRYEWHSLKYGDHNVYSAGPELPLSDAEDLPVLRAIAAANQAIAIPHHIGYHAGYRGIEWDAFREDVSPFVEIFSLHGCSLADDSPFPMLHDMGPRDFASTAVAGWERGHQFGIVGGTDHHGAYPGSFGDGRMGVFAKELTRDALWEAFLARRVFAATGDRIDARLFVNDAWIGESIESTGDREVRLQVDAPHEIDRVEVFKNDRLIRRSFPEMVAVDEHSTGPFQLQITWGWGRNTIPVSWDVELKLSTGEIRNWQTCFSGQAVVSPDGDGTVDGPDSQDLPHQLIAAELQRGRWRSVTMGNRSMRHETTQGLKLTIEAPLSAVLTLVANGTRIRYTLRDLLFKSRSTFLRGWLTEAIQVGSLVPQSACTVVDSWLDPPDQEVDRYRLQVAQKNGQWAWLTPIWVN